MLSRLAGLALSLAAGLAGCATTLDAEGVARAQRMNQFAMDMTIQSSMQSVQLANDLAMQATLNMMLINAIPLSMQPVPVPMP